MGRVKREKALRAKRAEKRRMHEVVSALRREALNEQMGAGLGLAATLLARAGQRGRSRVVQQAAPLDCGPPCKVCETDPSFTCDQCREEAGVTAAEWPGRESP